MLFFQVNITRISDRDYGGCGDGGEFRRVYKRKYTVHVRLYLHVQLNSTCIELKCYQQQQLNKTGPQ